MKAIVEKIVQMLPESFKPFENTEYPMPVSQAIVGQLPDIQRLGQWLGKAAEGELKNLMEPVAVWAEVIESAAKDRNDFFMDDQCVRSYVFRGAKWRAGWVLLAGDGISRSLVESLKARKYMIFSSQYPDLRDHALPARETGCVYFLQLMVRYAMIWGQIAPGEDHQMGHFLERDMPGAMVVMGKVDPAQGLVLLSLMKLGCPAVVDKHFGYDIGPRAVAGSEDEVIEALASFPNMRVRTIDGQELCLPEGADPAYLTEQVTPARVIRGVFELRAGQCESETVVSGPEQSDQVAVIVEICDKKLDLPVSSYLEAKAIGFGSYLPGITTRRDDDGAFVIELAEGTELQSRLLGQVIGSGLKRAYPRLGPIRVSLQFGDQAVKRRSVLAQQLNQARDQAILAESEETVEEFYACIDCQPFSHSHVCIVTPDRPPMCGRSRNEIKAGALWGTDYRPWTRRDKGSGDLQKAVKKGRAIDADAGEWSGINEVVVVLSGGTIERVRLHCVCQWPHSSCGCFAAVGFTIPGTKWLGVMDRSYKGAAPGELTWSVLANRAGGKQSPGVTGISLAYLKSPKAFAGDGGLGAVKWATARALEVMEPHLPQAARIATEEQVTTMEELESFLAGK